MSDFVPIPIVETYRGIGIHDFQPASRIEHVVKPEIDRVYLMTDARELFDYAGDDCKPPEARVFAGQKCQALWEIAAENREVRPAIDISRLKARFVGLTNLRTISARYYGTYWSPGPAPGENRPMRDVPLTDEQRGRARHR